MRVIVLKLVTKLNFFFFFENQFGQILCVVDKTTRVPIYGKYISFFRKCLYYIRRV